MTDDSILLSETITKRKHSCDKNIRFVHWLASVLLCAESVCDKKGRRNCILHKWATRLISFCKLND